MSLRGSPLEAKRRARQAFQLSPGIALPSSWGSSSAVRRETRVSGSPVMAATLARAAAASPPKDVPCSRARSLRSFRPCQFFAALDTSHSGPVRTEMGPIWDRERGVGVFTGPAPRAPVVCWVKGTGGASFIPGHWFAFPLSSGSKNPNTNPTSAALHHVAGDGFPPLPMPCATYS